MNSYKQTKGVRNIKTALTGDKRGNEQRVVSMRRLVTLETQRNRLSVELQKCLQKQHSLQEQIEDIIFEVEHLQEVLNTEVTVEENTGSIRSKLRTKTDREQQSTSKKRFIIEY